MLLRQVLVLCGSVGFARGYTLPLSASRPAASLAGVSLPRVRDGETIDLGDALRSSAGRTMLVLGTHAADFNAVEYMQRVRTFLPQLTEEKGIDRCLMVVNGDAAQCAKLAELVDLPAAVELLADPAGAAGRAFGVSRGFRPDDDGLNPYAKLFVMGVFGGPAAWNTLPAVLTGYFGNPKGRREWIDASLKQGQLAGRWPAVLELGNDGSIVANKFDDTPLLSGWGVRPFELATLRLQNLIGVQLKNYDTLAPADKRCLTQLGGCTVVGPGGDALYSWVDNGLCDVPDMHDLMDAL
jgi:hypothetical protein